MKHKESHNRDPLVKAAENLMVTEDVAKIKKKVAQLKVGDKTNYGTVKEIGSDSITFKAAHTPKTEIAFRQRKIGSPDYVLMNLVKFTPDGKKVDKTFKEANDFTGAAAAAAVAGEDEFEFNGKTYPVEMDLEVAKKIMSQSLKLAKQLSKDMDEDVDFIESNEFVGAAAAAKVAGEDEFEFDGKTYPVEIDQETAEKIMSQALDLAKDLAKAKKEESTELEEEMGSLQNSLKVLSKAGIGKGIARPGRVTDMEKLVQAIHQNYKAITGEKYQDSDQVAMSAIIADLIGHFRINGDKFISTWDKTIKEETEISEAKRMKYDKVIKKLRDGEWESSDDVKQGNHLNYTDNNTGKKKVVFVEATEFVKGDRVMDIRTKLKGTVLHKGNRDEVYVDLGAIKKAISSKNLRLVEAAKQLDEVSTKPRSRDEKNAIQKVERLINSLPGIVKNLDYIYSDMERFNMNISQNDIDNLGKLVKEIEKLSLNRKEYDLIKNNLHEETDLLEFQSRTVRRAEDALFKLETAVNQLSKIVKRGSTESKDLGNITVGTAKTFAKLEKTLNDFQKYLSEVKSDLDREEMDNRIGYKLESTELEKLVEGKFDKLKKKLGRLNPESLELVLTGKIKLSPAEKKEFDDFMKDLGQMFAKESAELEESKSATGYELYHKDFSSAMAHAYEFAKKKYRIEVDTDEITDKVALGPKRPSKGKTNRYRLLDKDGKKAIHVQVYGMDNGKYELNMYKESKEDLEESEHSEWFTCEIHVKSSGQLYSTFYVQARDMGEANKKADKVFKELMKTTYPKDWPSYQKKFTVKVKKGDNIGELMP